ncbi:MAG: hypothetical protein EBZ67_06525 [Chitinophagia bacterium]|nr:hypothetical protein [Chitinophagia bacterium]
MQALHYFPNLVSYVSSLRDDVFDVVGAEPYRKMSFRNRCIIAAANGPLTLSIPIQGGRGVRTPYREVRICERQDWRGRHWKTIASAYGKAPWFFHYAEGLEVLFRTPHDRLMDWNLACLVWVDRSLGLKDVERKVCMAPSTSLSVDLITPQDYKDPVHGPFPAYFQLFEEKHGFLPNLSILDFVMCVGMPGRPLLGL